jgi:FkbM family methyltransferase
MMHSDFMYLLRKLSRKIGMNKLIMNVIGSKKYEDLFGAELLACLSPGAVVWDVGANIGYYTKLFSAQVGDEGAVIAFEPFTKNFEKLTKNTHTLNNIERRKVALGSKNITGFGVIGSDEIGATNSVTQCNNSASGVQIEIVTGDSLINDGVPLPDVIKIDVEGAELEVLAGLNKYLFRSQCSLIFIEVHFEQLDHRGYKNGAKQLVSILNENSYEVQWIDPSHIKAVK